MFSLPSRFEHSGKRKKKVLLCISAPTLFPSSPGDLPALQKTPVLLTYIVCGNFDDGGLHEVVGQDEGSFLQGVQ